MELRQSQDPISAGKLGPCLFAAIGSVPVGYGRLITWYPTRKSLEYREANQIAPATTPDFSVDIAVFPARLAFTPRITRTGIVDYGTGRTVRPVDETGQ